jgi:hypothetical protein
MTMLASEIEVRLAKKFASPEFAFMPQMNQGTGSHAGRRADAVAFSLWPSRGLDLYGFEIKISRSDLSSEVRNPEKAEAIQRFCDLWWLVTPPGLTSDMDLLPTTWGVLEVDGRGVRVTKQAPRLTPEPMTRNVIAAMFRAFHETVPYLRENFIPADSVKGEIERRAQERIAAHRHDENHELRQLREAVAAFESASGIKIEDQWSAGRIGEVVNAIVKAGGPQHFVNTFGPTAARLRTALEAVEAAMDAIDRAKAAEVSA